jgi:hypothetical protein
VDASNRFTVVVRPEKVGFFSQFRQRPYEDQLNLLFSIHNGVILAGLARESIGKQLLSLDKSKVDAAEKSLNDAKASLSDSDITSNERAKQLAAAAIRNSNEIANELKAAVVQVPDLGPDVVLQTTRYEVISAAVQQVAATANQKQAAIRQAHLDAIRRAIESFPRRPGFGL